MRPCRCGSPPKQPPAALSRPCALPLQSAPPAPRQLMLPLLLVPLPLPLLLLPVPLPLPRLLPLLAA